MNKASAEFNIGKCTQSEKQQYLHLEPIRNCVARAKLEHRKTERKTLSHKDQKYLDKHEQVPQSNELNRKWDNFTLFGALRYGRKRK